MAYGRLFIFVEGPDDERFFEKVVIPRLENKYDCVEVRHYRKSTKEYLNRFIESINAMNTELMKTDYIFVTDIDITPCVTYKKQKIKNIYRRLDEDLIVVVKKEIESWYLAGLSDEGRRKLRVNHIPNSTNDITKEQFNSLKPKRFDSEIDFMLEVLKYFSIDNAKQRNASFKYFFDKFVENSVRF